jgi:hypothetical protein
MFQITATLTTTTNCGGQTLVPYQGLSGLPFLIPTNRTWVNKQCGSLVNTAATRNLLLWWGFCDFLQELAFLQVYNWIGPQIRPLPHPSQFINHPIIWCCTVLDLTVSLVLFLHIFLQLITAWVSLRYVSGSPQFFLVTNLSLRLVTSVHMMAAVAAVYLL